MTTRSAAVPDHVDVVVVGGGPGGLAAAMMLGRSRRRVLVVDSGSPRNRFAEHMQAVVGLDGVAPSQVRERGRAELERYGVDWLDAVVDTVTTSEDGVGVGRRPRADGAGSPATARVSARALVVATGIEDELPPVPGLADLWGRRVFHCPYCHGWEVRDQRIGVVATSEAGTHHAHLVRGLTDRVTVFATPEAWPAPRMVERLAAREVDVRPAVESVHEPDPASPLVVRTVDGGTAEVDALFVAPRPVARDTFLPPDLPRGDDGLLVVDAMGRSGHPRVWVVGNAANPMANVPLSLGSGSAVGGAVNGALAQEDFDRAEAAVSASR